jgi:hypothetical protein
VTEEVTEVRRPVTARRLAPDTDVSIDAMLDALEAPTTRIDEPGPASAPMVPAVAEDMPSMRGAAALSRDEVSIGGLPASAPLAAPFDPFAPEQQPTMQFGPLETPLPPESPAELNMPRFTPRAITDPPVPTARALRSEPPAEAAPPQALIPPYQPPTPSAIIPAYTPPAPPAGEAPYPRASSEPAAPRPREGRAGQPGMLDGLFEAPGPRTRRPSSEGRAEPALERTSATAATLFDVAAAPLSPAAFDGPGMRAPSPPAEPPPFMPAPASAPFVPAPAAPAASEPAHAPAPSARPTLIAGLAAQPTAVAVAPPPPSLPVVLDVTPRSLGIGTVAGYCEEIIRRNARVPSETRRMFTTSRDQQQMVRIRVCTGESRRIDDNVVLGDLVLDGLPARPRGQTRIAVTCALDASGILNVRARDAQTGQEQRATLDVLGAQSEAEVDAARQRFGTIRPQTSR